MNCGNFSTNFSSEYKQHSPFQKVERSKETFLSWKISAASCKKKKLVLNGRRSSVALLTYLRNEPEKKTVYTHVREISKQEEAKVLIYYKNHKICIPNSLFFLKYLFLGMNFFLRFFLLASRVVEFYHLSPQKSRATAKGGETDTGQEDVNALSGRSPSRLRTHQKSLSRFNYKF